MLLGCIGDDFTGSTDLANTLTKAGMHTTQYVGVPDLSAAHDVEAGIVALKSRSIPVDEAIDLSLAALDWLRAQGCTQFLFKYCSTFDSTRGGNIGPVAEALANELNARQVIMCPAFPAAGRSVYQGHLFVGDMLLSESGMEHHPLTPMKDPDIRRWLAHQIKGTVGHIPAQVVINGVEHVKKRMLSEDYAGHQLLIADAMSDSDLVTLARAATNLPLITGGSGIALGLPANFRAQGLLSEHKKAWKTQPGRAAILSGSCSVTTRKQVAHHAGANPTHEVTPDQVMSGTLSAQALADWAAVQDGLPLIYTSADPDVVAQAQARFGTENVAKKIETFFADLARGLVAGGITRLICAGGETSGAVVEGLGLSSLEIGPEIDPGVPMVRASATLVLALKSGNFGSVDFFTRAASLMESSAA